ncbi:hypothetical protein Cgig2_001168 [Carnegiea gigantea]|uniref:hAT-like transposase RNase-H fold domain-containing protein n=1 Tax=Carnegiea gigantea TaxID=171969 RepID=A0A9Q1Q7Q5_9CARY|nr:hypothetical protein Cgig2_001168 [Carnegiea gigantea]
MASYNDDLVQDHVREFMDMMESYGDNADGNDMEVHLESHVKVKKQASKMATNKEKGKQKRPPSHPTNLGDPQSSKQKRRSKIWDHYDETTAPTIIYGIGWTISSFLIHEDEGTRNMAQKMKLKRDKNWSNVNNVNVLLFIVVAPDPRYKNKHVEWPIRSSYDSRNAALLSSKIRVALHDLVEFYASSQPKAKKMDHGTSFSCSVGDKFTKLMGIDNEEVRFWRNNKSNV